MPNRLQRLRTLTWSTVLAAACFCLAVPVSAQRVVATVYRVGAPGSGSPNVVVVHNLATGQTELSQPGTGGGVFTSDGRYALLSRQPSSSAPIFELYDTVTRAVSRLPSSVANLGVAHPRDLAVYGIDNSVNGVARLDAGGVRPLPVCAPDITLGFDFSRDGAVIVALCANPFVLSNARVVIANSVTGQLVRAADLGQVPPRAIAANHDASRVLAVRSLSSNAFEVLLVDTVANQVTVLFVDSPFPTGPAPGGCYLVGTTRARDRAAVRCQWTNFTTSVERTELITFETGQRRTLTAVPSASTMHFSPDGSTAIVGTGNTFQILDVDADVLLAQVPVSNGIADVAYPPGAPGGLTATVSGARVELTWALPPSSPVATGYVLEVGSAPGLSNIGALTLGPATTLDVSAVPSGRYHVRVRGVNYTGRGAVSNDVVVNVP